MLSAFSHKCCFSKKAPRVLLPPRGGWPSNLGNTCRPCETQRVTVEMLHRRNSFHCDRLRGRLANIGRVGQPGQGTTGSMEGLSTDQLWSRYQETFRRIMGLSSCKLRRPLMSASEEASTLWNFPQKRHRTVQRTPI